tara:strand:+ start:193 stop:375 length:183 start_codon:yes stop_codon:yes gene_type:complete
MYHGLHEEVALGQNDKEQEQSERLIQIDDMRKKLIEPHAKGIVLETCIGTNMNKKYYNEN